MTTERRQRAPSTGRLRSLSYRVAVRATLLALVGGLVVCAAADVIVVNRLSSRIDGRLANQLWLVTHKSAEQIEELVGSTKPSASNDSGGDLDDVPVLAWFIPAGSTRALAMNESQPRLPRAYVTVAALHDGTLGGHAVRFDTRTNRLGRFVVATSTAQLGSVLATLLVIQGILAPLALLGLFVAATLIGRRAAAPIDRARRQQLEFTADASHELRTPLSVIEAEVSLALSANREAVEYRDTLQRVASESKRLRRIVEDLLWLARLDALPSSPAHDAVDVAVIAESGVERFGALAGERGITLVCSAVDEKAAVIEAPAEWVDQLTVVLLDNACRYAHDGGRVEVHVAVREDVVELRVEDDGPGFADGASELLLQRFHRASDVPGGSGLGLAIAHAVVQATKGTITLGGAEIGGARVTVTWPRHRGRGTSGASRATPPGAATGQSPVVRQ